MKATLTAYLNNLLTVVIFIVVAATPLLFTTVTTEYLETPKLILLVVAVTVGVVLWSLKWLTGGRVLITKTPLDLPLLLLLVIIVVSTLLADSRSVAILGNFTRIHGSAVSWVAYILFYFLLASNIRGIRHFRVIVMVLLSVTLLASLISLAVYFGIYLPFNFTQNPNFSSTGSTFSLVGLAILLLPLPLLSITNQGESRLLSPPLSVVFLTIFALTIAFLGSGVTILVALAVFALIILTTRRSALIRAWPQLTIPTALALLITVLSYLPTGNNLLYQKHQQFQSLYQEVQLPFDTSWKVAASAFRDRPFFGTGPGSFLFNFTSYKPIEHNNSRFWNVRFDSAFNEYLQVFGTLGLLGLLSLVFLSLVVINFAWKTLKNPDQGSATTLTSALALSAIAFIALMIIHPLTPVVTIASLTLLAILMITQKTISGKVEELSVGIKTSRLTDSSLIGGDILPIILFIPIVIASAVVLWNTLRVAQADFYHRQALNAAPKSGLETYNKLILAERLNPYADLYRVDLAQTNFALANAIALAKRPTEASPGGSLTDQDRQNIRQLLSQAIAEGRAAVALSPRSAQNWEVLGSIYRQISGVAQNALVFALDSYGRAIRQDPLNPNLRLVVGGVYYSVRNFDLAIRFFTDSVNLKPDFANGYYNLSVALRDKGDLRGAQLTAERTLALLDPASPDYQTASSYLTDLKARIATGSAQQASGLPPAAQEGGALQNRQLPSVLDLPQPEQIATPPAVRRNPRVPQISQPSPSPTP